jgi:hypothetical protein
MARDRVAHERLAAGKLARNGASLHHLTGQARRLGAGVGRGLVGVRAGQALQRVAGSDAVVEPGVRGVCRDGACVQCAEATLGAPEPGGQRMRAARLWVRATAKVAPRPGAQLRQWPFARC